MSIHEIPQMSLEEVHSRIARYLATNHIRQMVQVLPAFPDYKSYRFDEDGYLVDWTYSTDGMVIEWDEIPEEQLGLLTQ